ncbi:hypothetical protein [Nitrosopumilus sp.]|uniref:hypothetical protein n=1 Tax=Nitrosopumilus sp. TaxID=2024843 RepID=UPI003D0DB282
MKTKSITTHIAILHWIFYGFWIIPIIINPETWFFGEKFSGYDAITIHFAIGIAGFILGWLVYKKKKLGYLAGIVLFVIVLSSVLVNHFL